MALENYTRGQKIFMVTLIVVLAAMFTVTGAMLSLTGQGGKAAPADQGTVDGEAIRLMEFQRKRSALRIILGLDRASTPNAPDAPEYIYARVPTMSVQPQRGHDWPYNAQRPVDTSLLEVWPEYQDQYIWCHMVLVKEARASGIEERGNLYIGKVITALMNQMRQDIDKFDQKDLPKRFHDSYGQSIEDLLPTFREALMVRDYVESRVADEQARLEQVASIAEGNNEEVKAEFIRLKIGYFLEQARKDVIRESFRYKSAHAAAGFGVGTSTFGYDRFEEAYDKNKAKTLTSDASFSFQVIEAFPQAMIDKDKVQFEEEMLELMYKAVRDEMFKATDDDKARIDARLNDEFQNYSLKHAEETKDWGPEQIEKFKADHRDDLMKYRSFYEAQVDLRESLMRKESLKFAQSSIAAFLRKVDEEKARKQRQLTAQIDVIRKEEAVWEGKRAYVDDLRSRFDTMQMQLFAKARSVSNQMDNSAEGTDATANSNALIRIVDEFVRVLADFDREQIGTIISTANVTVQDLSSQLNNKLAEQDEFLAETDHRTSDNKVMSAEEVEAKKQQFKLEIEAINEKMRLRDAKAPLVEKFAEELRGKLADYELQIRNAKPGDAGNVDLRRYALRELLVELPVELGKFIKAQQDAIVPQDEADEYRNQAELIRADHQARQKNLAKDAGDTRNWNISQWTGPLGLDVEEQSTPVTWERVLESKLSWLENVDGARDFLEQPTNYAGSVSKIMAAPGKGYIILQLKEKTPKYTLGREEARDKVIEIAAMKRARELAVEALKALRRDIVDNGWSGPVEKAKAKYGEFMEVDKTPFFNEKMDIPGIYSDSDNDVLKLSSSPSAVAPDQPFVSRIKDIDPAEGITKVISEKHNPDPLKRPENEEWAYLLARVIERRLVTRRLTEDNLKEHQYGSTPAEIWRNRRLATSEVVRKLITPAELLEGHEIIQQKPDSKKDNSEGNEEDKS
ncbi:MAG: hypothetical protein H6839_14560 [Planctomycetes bacterium]|nr:hypothetical protein [Planctomycetota bacterium]